ncbi:substrate-binding domain-containing protein [Clostridium pasteurianum]|uniref:DNA-binding protein, excisionase family n=1 Tax=Clostridium pasteurianum BC1 TaxID=86416 RepID=R4K8W3_CLOPA|nr:helix-turn-helix transcriptional regulator [Clostridium pasteurianum]AGK96065.1 DNA-binding protein, excisionase family [Clostridium pasteurianum BC1]
MSENSSLTPQEVADILKIAKTTVYELIKRGELNAYRIGRRVRVEQSDVEDYKNRSKNLNNVNIKGFNNNNISKNKTINSTPILNFNNNDIIKTYNSNGEEQIKTNYNTILNNNIVLMAGEDVLLDILSRYLSSHPKGAKTMLSCVSSYKSLVSLYEGEAQIATCHLWDGKTGEYNIPYIEKLLPGIPAVIVHLSSRTQGFYVKKGNPKKIKNWEDLRRKDITIANRENGSGTRVLLDQHLKLLGISSQDIKGYNEKYLTHLTVASVVSSGKADLGLGIEKAAFQVQGIDFIPLQKEKYDLVIKKEDLNNLPFKALIEILNSENFRIELDGIGGYDLSETGKIVEI